MKSGSQVRRPSLVSSGKVNEAQSLSVGDVMRKAKRDLFFSRCVIGILVALLVCLIAFLIYSGVFGELVDRILAFME